MFASWQPLENPTDFAANFRLWRKALKMTMPEESSVAQVQVYGSSTIITTASVLYVLSHFRSGCLLTCFCIVRSL